MDGSGSSFIPQRPTSGRVAAKSFRKIYVLSYVSYLIFFSTLLAVAGVFIYQWTLNSELNSLRAELVAQKNLFNQNDLDRVRHLDYRIDAARQLINNHISMTTILDALDQVVTTPIQFTTFAYDRKEDINRPKLTVTASADKFDQVIFQKQVMSNNDISKNFNIAEINLDTQPIDEDQLELGARQVVNVSFEALIPVAVANYKGATAGQFTTDNNQESQAESAPAAEDESSEASAAATATSSSETGT